MRLHFKTTHGPFQHGKAHVFFQYCSALFLLLLFLTPDPTYANDSITSLIDNGGVILTRNKTIIKSHNPEALLIPASIWKIATALTAFDLLGENFRFQTRFFTNGSGDLIIQGMGDPFLISEEIPLILEALTSRGLTQINDIIVDTSLFDLTNIVDGSLNSQNPYDAANSALAVNFNTINIEVMENGIIRSAEPQTPLLPIMKKLGADLQPPGMHRINIAQNSADSIALTGELFRAFQQIIGIAGHGVIRLGKAPEQAEPMYAHTSSKTLAEIIPELLLYSNNFIANQIFLIMGAKQFGYPATWEKGRKAMSGYLSEKIGLMDYDFTCQEGSGLSRKNLITASAMLKILEKFKPYAELLPTRHDIRMKSGNLQGIYSYAGYFEARGQLDPFVVILNQQRNNRDKILNDFKKVHESSEQ
ncbi:MAG: D-alanyl-D-alanine carboxypeptidase [Proteobacteria bacterium]|nr:D-alanyl-D-alanine carboxypeptidase [Pseudomonadota bacterium]